jgi:hypothetical protein
MSIITEQFVHCTFNISKFLIFSACLKVTMPDILKISTFLLVTLLAVLAVDIEERFILGKNKCYQQTAYYFQVFRVRSPPPPFNLHCA